jgi:hypothetical protein
MVVDHAEISSVWQSKCSGGGVMGCMVEECRNMDKGFLGRHEEKWILEKLVNKVICIKCRRFLLESPSSSNKWRAGDCNNLSQTGTIRLKEKC